jgi:hypothetical protein
VGPGIHPLWIAAVGGTWIGAPSGKLGGRPRKITSAEARERALQALVPPAVATLKAHIESGAPDAWKASVRVLEMAFAGHDIEEPSLPTDAADIASMGWRELTVLAARLTLDAGTDVPSIASETDDETTNVIPSIVTSNGGTDSGTERR